MGFDWCLTALNWSSNVQEIGEYITGGRKPGFPRVDLLSALISQDRRNGGN